MGGEVRVPREALEKLLADVLDVDLGEWNGCGVCHYNARKYGHADDCPVPILQAAAAGAGAGAEGVVARLRWTLTCMKDQRPEMEDASGFTITPGEAKALRGVLEDALAALSAGAGAPAEGEGGAEQNGG